jgi:hypothetical protein
MRWDDAAAVKHEVIGDDPSVAAPPYRFRAHDCRSPTCGKLEQPFKARAELVGQRIISIIVEALVVPEAVDLGRHAL